MEAKHKKVISLSLRIKKDVYIAYFFQNVNGISKFIGKKRFLPHSNIIQFKKLTYIIDVKNSMFQNKNKIIYFIDVVKGQIISTETTEISRITPQVLDFVISQNIFSQFLKSIVDKISTSKIISLIFYIAFGCLLGFIIGRFVK